MTKEVFRIFVPDIGIETNTLTLSGDNYNYCHKVLRLVVNNEIEIVNGKGYLGYGQFVKIERKSSIVNIIKSREYINPLALKNVAIGISLLKNKSRFEWFLEKATELGVGKMIPLLCHKTQKNQFSRNRAQNIIVSALLQSKQLFMPALYEIMTINDLVKYDYDNKFVAQQNAELQIKNLPIQQENKTICLIGPEADFTEKELELLEHNHFSKIHLHNSRLRTETAGIHALSLLSEKLA